MSVEIKTAGPKFVDNSHRGKHGLKASSCGFGYVTSPSGVQVCYVDYYFAIGLCMKCSEPIVGEVMDSICFCLENRSSSDDSVFLLLIKEPVSGKNMLYSIRAKYWNEPDKYGPIKHYEAYIQYKTEIGGENVEIHSGKFLTFNTEECLAFSLLSSNSVTELVRKDSLKNISIKEVMCEPNRLESSVCVVTLMATVNGRTAKITGNIYGNGNVAGSVQVAFFNDPKCSQDSFEGYFSYNYVLDGCKGMPLKELISTLDLLVEDDVSNVINVVEIKELGMILIEREEDENQRLEIIRSTDCGDVDLLKIHEWFRKSESISSKGDLVTNRILNQFKEKIIIYEFKATLSLGCQSGIVSYTSEFSFDLIIFDGCFDVVITSTTFPESETILNLNKDNSLVWELIREADSIKPATAEKGEELSPLQTDAMNVLYSFLLGDTGPCKKLTSKK